MLGVGDSPRLLNVFARFQALRQVPQHSEAASVPNSSVFTCRLFVARNEIAPFRATKPEHKRHIFSYCQSAFLYCVHLRCRECMPLGSCCYSYCFYYIRAHLALRIIRDRFAKYFFVRPQILVAFATNIFVFEPRVHLALYISRAQLATYFSVRADLLIFSGISS